ncbi:MAG: mannonate dehydratase [Candidatus Poribacteria bacterium]|nr:mannonate dehydratase [Candidatus Poribacteria bacterium]
MDRPEKHSDKKAAMHVGVQGIGTSPKELAFLVRHGVTHMDASVENTETETLIRHKEEAAEAGVSLEMIHIEMPRSITLAQDPQRDKDIEGICKTIENAAVAGLRGLNYNFCILVNQRTENTYGRGGSSYSTFDFSKYDNETLSEAGEVSREEAFDRIAYFLERVIPVAEANRIQMACHPNDPPAPILRGVERWNYPAFDGLKRYAEIVDSPYHGFNFCCGTVSEGLDDPGTEFYEILRYFGEQQKLFNIHFRNIRGGLHNFQEVWPDEGHLDMHKVAQTLRDVEYPYMLMPDHAPGHSDDPAPPGVSGRVRQAWAFQFGYIIALIQAVNSES